MTHIEARLITLNGPQLLASSDVSFPVGGPTLSGTSLYFGIGDTGDGTEPMLRWDLFTPGTINATDPTATIAVTVNMTRQTTSWNPAIALWDGTKVRGGIFSQNTGGEIFSIRTCGHSKDINHEGSVPDEAGEVFDGLLVAGGDAAILFDAVKEAFDLIAVLIASLVVAIFRFPTSAGFHTRIRLQFFDFLACFIPVLVICRALNVSHQPAKTAPLSRSLCTSRRNLSSRNYDFVVRIPPRRRTFRICRIL